MSKCVKYARGCNNFELSSEMISHVISIYLYGFKRASSTSTSCIKMIQEDESDNTDEVSFQDSSS